jgi:hypothetical protein
VQHEWVFVVHKLFLNKVEVDRGRKATGAAGILVRFLENITINGKLGREMGGILKQKWGLSERLFQMEEIMSFFQPI